ncbi:hypothetical protein N7931_12930 [Catenovulum sp. 2E275]|uniref:hypothetical protein n=1 Tax=Catenovulum sp. 2E275 TaxID=2980497 RepID=UPI0021D21701|nr:hypothetical protein [Catenovulum sp. 2E275]MCU4676534.1 hypothetical protein [Catenovulum sp. 2E275]
MKLESFLAKPAINVSIRTILAILGGYSLSAALSLLLASFAGLDGRESEVFIRMIFFISYTVTIIWTFSVNSERKIITQMCLLNVLLWLAVLLTGEA